MIAKCIFCGKEFIAKNKNKKVCGDDHYENCPVCGKWKKISPSRITVEPTACSYACRAKRTQQTSLEKYGCKAPGNNPEARKKASETMMKNLGVPYAMMSKDVREKSKEKLIEKYGVDNIAKNPEYKMKAVQTSIDRYGMLPFNSPESYEKQHQTIMKRYGVNSALEIPHVMESTSRNHISKLNINLKDRIEKYGYHCQLEYNIEGKFYDIRIEDTPYIIELNPTYTHTSYADSTNPEYDMYYHRNRSIVAESKGLQCIHIWDWDNQTKVLGSIIKTSRYKNNEFEIYRLNSDIANRFFKTNDVRGEVKGNALYVGAIKDNEVFACIAFTKSRYNKKFDIELIRYTQKLFVEIPGIFDILSTHASSIFEINRCIAYMDYSKPYNQSILEEMGMKFSYKVPPAKIYSKGTKFYTRSLVERKFNTVETINKENGWLPVYTCGSKVYIFEG